ncbi:hypothetical protein [Winogradskyella flava]|uniref:hypothetical protein n=1 Tax=Winogradskyella flava TaxID=1884876 RepID=UPI00249071A9|nr:hypothetical protein [Winogradskyella flava]
MKYYITLILLVFSLLTFAQKVEKDGNTYEVKDEKIFLNGEDVTETLSVEDKAVILKEATMISEKMKAEEKARKEKEKAEKKKEKEANKLEKDQKKAEKAAKKAEKDRKKAEKALKKEQKIKENYKKAQDNLSKAQKKYDKLKKKGKLSPVDESKWLEKIEKLTEKVAKAKQKL